MFKNSVVKAQAIRLIRDAIDNKVLIAGLWFADSWANSAATDYCGGRCSIGAMAQPHIPTILLDLATTPFSIVKEVYGLTGKEMSNIMRLNDALARAMNRNDPHVHPLKQDLFNYLEAL